MPSSLHVYVFFCLSLQKAVVGKGSTFDTSLIVMSRNRVRSTSDKSSLVCTAAAGKKKKKYKKEEEGRRKNSQTCLCWNKESENVGADGRLKGKCGGERRNSEFVCLFVSGAE